MTMRMLILAVAVLTGPAIAGECDVVSAQSARKLGTNDLYKKCINNATELRSSKFEQERATLEYGTAYVRSGGADSPSQASARGKSDSILSKAQACQSSMTTLRNELLRRKERVSEVDSYCPNS